MISPDGVGGSGAAFGDQEGPAEVGFGCRQGKLGGVVVKRFIVAACVPTLVLMAACGGGGSMSVGAETAVEQPAQTSTGLIPIQSDNVAAAGYDSSTQTLTVQFLEGAVYQYAPVPQSLWDDFVAAQPHPWSAVGYPRLVEAKVPYWRVS